MEIYRKDILRLVVDGHRQELFPLPAVDKLDDRRLIQVNVEKDSK